MSKEKFSVKKRIKGFGYAFNGLRLLMSEHNVWIHCTAAIAVIILGFYFNISATEWVELCFAIGSVMGMEAANTAIERLCNLVSPEKHPLIKQVKDLSAAGVFIFAVAALAVGLIIFLPKIFFR